MLYLATFEDARPVVVDIEPVESDEAAYRHVCTALERHEMTDEPIAIYRIPGEVFAIELFRNGDDETGEPNPGDHASSGVAFEPFDALTEWLDRIPEHPDDGDDDDGSGPLPSDSDVGGDDDEEEDGDEG